jgi:uncharacterized protein YdhG (YjbR/CyaY superfamily)
MSARRAAAGKSPKPTGAATVAEYLAALPEDRRAPLAKLRAFLKKRVPKGYREGMLWDAITWSIPLEDFPETYNGQPLCYAAIASQKRHLSLYLICAYGDAAQRRQLEDGFKKAGKKLDMGKSCIRFQELEDLPLDVIGDVLAAVPPKQYMEIYRRAREGARSKRRQAPAR